MAQREYSLLFKINAALSEQFGAALKSAQNAMKGLQGSSKTMSGAMSTNMAKLQGKYNELNSIAVKMRQFSNLQEQVGKSTESLNKGRAESSKLKAEYVEQVKQTQAMAEAFKQLKAYYKENKNSMSAEQRGVVQQQIKDAAGELELQRLRERDAGKAASAQSAAVGKLQAQLEQQKAALSAAQAALSAAGVNAQQFANEEAKLRAEIERTTQAIERQGQIDARRERFNQAGQNLSDSYGNFQNSVDTARSIMSPFKSALDEAVSYEQSMSKLKALTQTKNIRAGDFETVNREMAAMDSTIKHLGATTEFTTTEVAQAAQKFAMSGWGSQQIQDALKPVIDITTATGNRDVVKIADYLTDEMQALGLTDKNKFSQQQIAANMKSYGDAFAYALTQSNNDADSFHEAMKYMAPVGTQAGMSVSEQVAMAMTMADSGIKGSMGGTAGRMGILRLIAPPKAAVKAMESMGLMASDAQKAVAEAGAEMESLGITADDSIGVRIQKLKKSFEGMDEKEVAAKLSKITGVNAVSGWGALLKDLDKFNERVAEMDSGATAGWAETVAGTMRDNTATQFELFNSAVSAAATSLGTLFLPVVRQATQMMTGFAEGLNKFIQANPQMAAGIAAVAAGLSGLIVASAGAKLALAGFEYVSSGFLVLKDSITSVVTAMAGLPARIAAAFTALRGMSFASMFAGIAGLGASLLPVIGIAAAVAAAGYFIYSNWSQIAPVISNIGATLSASLSTAFAALSPAINNIIASVGNLASAIAPIVGVLGAAIGTTLLTALNTAANLFATLISTAANAVATIINLFANLGNVISNLLQGNFSQAFDGVINTIKSAIDGIKSTIGSLFDGIGQTFSTFLDPIKSLMGINAPAPVAATAPTETAVQAQTVQVQAAEVQQQDTGILQSLQETVSQVALPIQTFGQAAEPAAQSMTTFATSTEQAATSLQPTVDALTQLSTAIQPVAEGFTNLSTSIQPVGESFNQINAGVTTFNAEITNSGAQLQAANAGVMTFTASLTGTNGAITGFTGALTGSVGAVTGLGSAASGASGSISGLGSAAASACAALAAAGANAAAAVSAATASIPTAPVAANYRGGIYPKGEFITTFAEKSAEAAIPLDNSSRAISLWQRAGQILGVYPGNNKSFDTPPKYDALGNIEGLNGLADNIITEFDSLDVIQDKKDAQLKEFNSKMSNIKPARSENIFSKKINLPTSIFNNSTDNIFSNITDSVQNIFSNFNPANIFNTLSDNIFNEPDILGNILNPTPTFPTADNIETSNNTSDFNITFQVTINGNANAEDVRNGIEMAIPAVEDFAEKFNQYQHERQRTSFA